MKLTIKQQSFINHYLANGGNGTQAARSAKYKGSDNTLAAVAKENIRKPHIKEFLDKAIAELKLMTGISAENKRNMLWDVARRCSQEIKPVYINGKKTDTFKFDSNGVVKAIAELNKMDGDHAPAKTDLTINPNDVTPWGSITAGVDEMTDDDKFEE